VIVEKNTEKRLHAHESSPYSQYDQRRTNHCAPTKGAKMNATQKIERLAMIRNRVEARREYAADFEMIPVACIEPGSYVLDMIAETLETLEIEEQCQRISDSFDIIPMDFAAQVERISGRFDLLEGLHTLDVADFIDSGFEIMGVSR